MEYSRELLFFFSALGAFNGLLMGCYFLFFTKPRQQANTFLGAFLIAISIRIGKSVFFYFNHDLHGTYLQIGLTACLFIGPFLYFYLRTAIKPEKESWTGWKYHLMILLPLALIVGYLYPFESSHELWQQYFINGIYFIWFFYLVLSAFVLKNVLRKIFSRKEKMNHQEIWMSSILIGTSFIWLAYNTCPYTSYITGALTFSFVLYLLALFMFLNRKQQVKTSNNTSKYAAKKITTPEALELLQRLETLMNEQEIFKNPNLKLPDVAQQMNILPHRLSQLLNDNLGKNFPLYINEYRIQAAKKMICTNDEFTLEAIGYECGFNSKSSFYATFKKLTGTTPAKFKENPA